MTVPHRTHHSMEPAFRQERVALGWRRWVGVGGIIVVGNVDRGAPAHKLEAVGVSVNVVGG